MPCDILSYGISCMGVSAIQNVPYAKFAYGKRPEEFSGRVYAGIHLVHVSHKVKTRKAMVQNGALPYATGVQGENLNKNPWNILYHGNPPAHPFLRHSKIDTNPFQSKVV